MSHPRTLALGWGLALLTAAAFSWLGFWQLARMHGKQAALDAVHAVLAARDARPLAVATAPLRANDYDWVAGEGHFVDTPAVLLDNQEHAGRAGLRAYRLFQPAGPTTAPLLVELGWLPVPGDRRLPPVPRPSGALRIAGLMAPPPSAGLVQAVAMPQPDGNLLATTLDVELLRRTLRLPALAPRVLKLDPALPFGYVRDLDILPNTLPPARHLGYAVQWFGLALAVLATALVLTFRIPKRNSRP